MNTVDANSPHGNPGYASHDRPWPPPGVGAAPPPAAPQKAPRKQKSPPEDKKPRKPRDVRAASANTIIEPPHKRPKTSEDWDRQLAPQPSHLHPAGPGAYPPYPVAMAHHQAIPADPRDVRTPAMPYDRGPPPPPPSSRPATSGQRYDPIRAASAENASHGYAPPAPPPSASGSGSSTFRSPHSMSMILNDNPPAPPHTSTYGRAAPAAAESHSSTPILRAPPQPQVHHSPPSTAPSHVPPPVRSTSFANQDSKPPTNGDVHPSMSHAEPIVQQRRPSPKPRANKEPSPAPAPVPTLTNGTSATAERVVDKPKEFAEVSNQCIVIEIPMKPEGGTFVHFMKEVEQKYGFDVAHPQIAEHRRRMKDMAAAGALLEAGIGSADEMNLDVSDAGSDGEANGAGDHASASEGPKGRRKQRNDYDKDDDFIDDTEMAWEERALASKDGYFVWSGPLVQDGDKPTVERADGTVRRGRGSGRGRGGSSRGESGTGRGRGMGRGSRGGNTVRKPRVTKADRARMEHEKQERERMAATASKPPVA